MLFEGALEMRLVGKTGRQRHVCDQRAVAQLGARKLNAPVDQKRMRREPVILFERADQVGRRQLGRQANIFQLQRLGAVRADVLGGALQLVVDLPHRRQRRVQTLLHLGEITHQRALLLQQLGLLIQQQCVELDQTVVQHAVAGVRRVERPITLVGTETQLVLQVSQPRRVEVQHVIRPRLVVDRVARMHIARVHQHHRAGADLKRLRAVVVITAPGGDRADGKVLVGVAGIRHLAPVGDGARLNERQALVTPEARRLRGVSGGVQRHGGGPIP